jgi:hypothetical protein
LPDGLFGSTRVQPHLKKYFGSRLTQITSRTPASCSLRGAYRDRHGRWARDAVDAAALKRADVMAGRVSRERSQRADERRYSRTVKSCGPDAPALASSLRRFVGPTGCGQTISAGDGDNKPITGESTKEAVKTIAQGRPGVSGEPVVTILVCHLHVAREAAGAAGTRLSLRPLFSWANASRTTRAHRAAGSRNYVF